MKIRRWRVELEDNAHHLQYMVLRTIEIADHTVAEVIECGPSALFKGYPVFMRTVVEGTKPIMFLQGRWRMIKYKVKSIKDVSNVKDTEGIAVPDGAAERVGRGKRVAGRRSVDGADVQRTRKPRAGKQGQTGKAARRERA